MKYPLLIIMILSISVASAQRTDPASQSAELGKVSWYRNYDQAIDIAKKQNKAVLILFQEVPGCATCKNYGNNVLSYPLMVEAIENEFVPLLVHNNKKGEDSKILRQFNEPSWNNPVVRIIDPQGNGLVDRVAGNYTSIGLFSAMAIALQAESKPVPKYMELLGSELAAQANGNTRQAYFQMYCFWSGEGHLGAAEGVVATEPGFMGGHEVVKVSYDHSIISEEELAGYAKTGSASPVKNTGSFRKDKDPQYYLKHTDYKYLPLSPLQKSKINSAIGKRQSAEQYLSPKQQQWLVELHTAKSKSEILYDKDFEKAWVGMIKK